MDSLKKCPKCKGVMMKLLLATKPQSPDTLIKGES